MPHFLRLAAFTHLMAFILTTNYSIGNIIPTFQKRKSLRKIIAQGRNSYTVEPRYKPISV